MNIVVLSRDTKLYSTKRLVEACHQRGHEVRVVDHVKCDLSIEKRNPQVIYNGEPITGVDAIIPRIGASVTFFGTAVVRQFEILKDSATTESQNFAPSLGAVHSPSTSFIPSVFTPMAR